MPSVFTGHRYNCRCEIKYSNEYYDTLGLERPDGTESDMKLLEFAPVTFTFVKKDTNEPAKFFV